ncbi:HAD-like domain-containing protein [Melampsora americana]|nr:HAD-like domain-containing protein [Melampsora americana]
MSEFNLCSSYSAKNQAELIVDAILFDMDGTLVDSIAAVESAWGAVAETLKKDPQEVIDATHGRRAIDNLKDLKPHLRRLSNVEMEPHVEEFETEILRQADDFQTKVQSRRSSAASSKRASRETSRRGSMATHDNKSAVRRKSSLNQSITADGVTSRMAALGLKPLTSAPLNPARSPSGGANGGLSPTPAAHETSETVDEDVFADDDDEDSIKTDNEEVDVSDLTDKSVKILPGVRRIIDALPEGRYAVATSGAKTYCYGALKRVGIVPPKVTITADDPRLKGGKPLPDPFILAAECLGFDPAKCLVIEDSPSGIKAGVASGAKTIAVCTSHPHEKISHCGAHWLIPTLELVQIQVLEDGRLKVFVDASAREVDAAHQAAIKSSAPPQLLFEKRSVAA